MKTWRPVATLLAALMLFATLLHAHAAPGFETTHASVAAAADSGCTTDHAGPVGGAAACASGQACPFCAPVVGEGVAADRPAATVYALPQWTATSLKSTPPRRPPKPV